MEKTQTNNEESKVAEKIHKVWKKMCIQTGFKILENLGQGTYGTVMKAQCQETKQVYAVKLIDGAFETPYRARQLLREIRILRKLSTM